MLVGVFSETSFILSIIVLNMAGVLFSIAVVTPKQTAENTCSLGNGEGTIHFTAFCGSFVIRAKAGKTAEELAFWLVGQVGRRPATGMPARPPGNVDSRDPIPSGSFGAGCLGSKLHLHGCWGHYFRNRRLASNGHQRLPSSIGCRRSHERFEHNRSRLPPK